MSDSFPVFRNSRGRASLAPADQPPLGREQERVDDGSEEPEHEGSHDDLRRDEEGAASMIRWPSPASAPMNSAPTITNSARAKPSRSATMMPGSAAGRMTRRM